MTILLEAVLCIFVLHLAKRLLAEYQGFLGKPTSLSLSLFPTLPFLLTFAPIRFMALVYNKFIIWNVIS